jgi:competence protein ComEC
LRLPALVVALAWCVAIAGAVVLIPAQPVIGAIAVALALPVAGLALVSRPAIVALALAGALLGVGRAELPAVDMHAAARAISVAGHTAVVAGRVADDSRAAAGGAEVLVEPAEILIDGTLVSDIGNLMVRWRGPVVATFGDEVQATGRLTLPRDLPTFDRRAYLAQRQAFLELQAISFDVTAKTRGLLQVASWVRDWFTSAVDSALPAPHAAVLLGVVLGVRQGIPADLQNALIATGLVHLLVLSGLKVAVFARIVQGVMRPVLGRHATWPALALIGMYALAGGATPAAVRASLMGGLAIAAQRLGRPTHVWTSLALTGAAMLGWRPELAWDVGFQLSFAGTAAIILLTPGIEHRVAWLPQFVREPFAVTCAAQVGTLPMMATDFHLLSPVGPIANALVLPLLPALVAAGLMLGPLSFIPELARAAAIPIAGVLEYLEQVAYLLAKVPAGAVSIPRFPAWAGVAYYGAIGPAVAGAHMRGRARRIALLSALGAPILIATAAAAMWMAEPAQASVLSVGAGQAVLLHGPRGSVLIDAGPSPGRLADGLGLLLPPWQRTLDAIVITAPTIGHVGGFTGFDRPVGSVLLPDVQFPGTAWRTTAVEAAARGAHIERVLAGGFVEAGGFRLEFVAPEARAPGEVIGAADLGLRAVSPSGRSFCDLSDLDGDAQTLAASRLRGACTYLLLPDGGRTGLSPDLENVMGRPELIASVASGRLAIGFPPTVLRTDQEGTITVPM